MLARLFSRKPAPAPAETAESIAATARWVEQALGTEDGFRFAQGCEQSLLATAFGVCALEVLGALDGLPAQRREAIAGYIKRCQSAESGLFRDPKHDDTFVFALRKFTPLYIEWQETYFALHALDALGHKASHPLHFVAPYQQPSVLDGWLRILRFDDFWFSSNYLMFLLFFFIMEEGETAPSAHRLLDWLDMRQDPQTGLWGSQQGASLFNAMAGAFHVYGFYRYLDRPILHQGAAVRSTLKTQQKTGMYGSLGGGPCEDLDAVDILVNLKPDSAGDDQAVRASLEKTLLGLRACRLDDGGYRWTAPLPGAKVRNVTYSGLPSLAVTSDQGDLWSVWFRPLAIALAHHRLGREAPWPVRYRRLPLLGFGPDG